VPQEKPAGREPAPSPLLVRMHPDVGRRSLGPKRTTPPKRNMIAWRRWHFRGRVFKSRHPKFSKRRAGLRWHEIGRFLTQKRERSTDWWVVQRVAIPISAHPPRPQLPPIWGRFFWSAVLTAPRPAEHNRDVTQGPLSHGARCCECWGDPE
jgi:hypothetical protein